MREGIKKKKRKKEEELKLQKERVLLLLRKRFGGQFDSVTVWIKLATSLLQSVPRRVSVSSLLAALSLPVGISHVA